MTAFAPLLQAFFTDRLMTQYGASPHTIASYRDTFRLLLAYVHRQTGTLPTHLDLADLDATTIGDFLHELETVRGNSPAARNTRLTLPPVDQAGQRVQLTGTVANGAGDLQHLPVVLGGLFVSTLPQMDVTESQPADSASSGDAASGNRTRRWPARTAGWTRPVTNAQSRGRSGQGHCKVAG